MKNWPGSTGFKIGIAWQGRERESRVDRWRSMPLASFAPLARLPGVQLISLQKGLGSEQIADGRLFRCSIFPTGWMKRPGLSWTRRP